MMMSPRLTIKIYNISLKTIEINSNYIKKADFLIIKKIFEHILITRF